MNKYVVDWQNQLVIRKMLDKADGDFGPKTLAASMEVLTSGVGNMDLIKSHAPPSPPTSDEPNFMYTPPNRIVGELIWHCSATPEGKHFSVEDIRRWHLDRGWSDIGYHYVVYLDGSIHEGRSNERAGAHVAGRNTGTIGACYIGGVNTGGVPKDTRTKAQKRSMLELTRLIASDPRIKKISGHNQYAAKACPSFNVRVDPLGNIPGFKNGERI